MKVEVDSRELFALRKIASAAISAVIGAKIHHDDEDPDGRRITIRPLSYDSLRQAVVEFTFTSYDENGEPR